MKAFPPLQPEDEPSGEPVPDSGHSLEAWFCLQAYVFSCNENINESLAQPLGHTQQLRVVVGCQKPFQPQP